MLLDTNVLIIVATRAHKDHERVRSFLAERSGFFVSALSLVEFLGWPEATPGDLAVRELIYEGHRELATDASVHHLAAKLRRRRKGLKTPDAIIAATALLYGIPLVTRNVRDFAWIEELEIIDPAAPSDQ